MAKKKVNHQRQDSKTEKPQDQTQTLTHQEQQQKLPSMEDSKEKLQNLKSLNSLLIKETFERRQQVESLMQAKEALETELQRSGLEKTELETELTRASEERVSLDIERLLLCVFIETQMGEMGASVDGLVKEKRKKESEIGILKSDVKGLILNLENEKERLSLVCHERDLLRSDLDDWVKESNGLTERVIEMEKKERETEEEFGKLKAQYVLLIKQKKEVEKEMEELKRSKDSAEKGFVERTKEIEDLKRDNEGILREKNEIALEKNGQEVKISELEKEIRELNEIVLSLEKEEGVLCKKVLDLENSYGEAMKKEKAMAMEIDALMEEKREKESIIKRLMEEKQWSEESIQMANIEMKDKNGLIEKLLGEKKEIEEVKIIKEREIVELHKEVGRLRDDMFAMQESIKHQEDKNRQLASEVSHYKNAGERVRLERDNAEDNLDQEVKNSMKLRSRVLELEKKIEETVAKIAKMKIESENLIEEKKEMENLVSLLKREKDLAQKILSEAQRETDDLRTKIESAAMNSERTLIMLKSTAALVCQPNDGKEEVLVTEKKLDNEIESYATELEAIKNTFRNKETVVEEMKHQVELLKKSAAEQHKKNNMFSVVTSVLSAVIVASFAYIARVR